MNNTPNNPNRRPTQGAKPAQGARPAAQGARPAAQGAKPTPQGTRSVGTRPAQGTRPAAQGAKPAGTKPAGTRPPQNNNNRKKKGKLNKDGILAIIMLFLVVVLAAIIIICCIKAIVDTASGGTTTDPAQTTTGTNATTAPQDPVYSVPQEGDWNYGFEPTKRNNSLVKEGNLILVNNDHAYEFPSKPKLTAMWGQAGYGSVYLLGTGMTYPDGTSKSVELSSHIVEPLTTMLTDMKAANATLTASRKLMIASGFRTYEKQETLYGTGADPLVAKPGHSEHHTGLTADIRIATDTDKSGNLLLNETEQAWITANCTKYGFILRYTEDNKDVTQIGGEDWHFRYVGVAHATYMKEKDLCLEEYIAHLRENYHYGKEPLNYTAEGTNYTIYYFPASVENVETNIYVPATGHYEISGNNVDGFIVTVTHESK